ncbi:DNA translocase FtsK [Lachnoclostridium pacaense]|uniref:DNA translocase FtsK n=1 Tax=Enterocloster hominis (ex Hitch et al. 2024) TaxID=1917870 RepID=UPI001D12D196|nr:DNA translocase FtsK [Lachnoclostridium pacaense]MCC2879594.1 DNA translocase FtsK [Lachnoclostridium pacaense]
MAESSKRQQSGNRKPGRPKGSTAGKKTTPSKGRKASGKKGYTEENTEFIRAEVVIICSFAVAILLFLSNFKLCGVVGDVLRGVQLGIFGMVGYLLPILIFVGTCFHLSNQGNLHAAMKLAAVVVAVLVICGLLQLFFGTTPAGAPWGDYYKQSTLSGVGGGFLGGILTSFLVVGLGKPGTFLVLAVLFIICMVCITERSFVSVVKKGGDKAYQYAREDMDRRREIHAQRAEERKRLREEQKVRGVNLDATRLTAYDEYDGDGGYDEYDEEAFDREYGADLEPLEEPYEDEASLGRVGAAAAPSLDRGAAAAPVNEFRGKFDPPLEHGTGEDASFDMDDVGALARSIEGHRHRREDAPVVTGITVEEDGFGLEGSQDVIHVHKDSRTLEEMDMAVAAQGNGWPEEEVPWDSGTEDPGTGDGARGQEEDFPETDTYMEDDSEQGLNYDSVFVPEEPKRVVTASGKVIETETELLKKKIEKKKEGTAKGDTEISVAEEIKKKEEVVKKEYVFPPTTLLKKGSKSAGAFSGEEYKATAIKLQQTLHNFGVGVTVTNISCGPAVTRYELLPEQGVKVSKIVGLTDDIKLSLAAADIRIEAPIPGKSAVGIEVPNKENNMVYLRELLEAESFISHKSRLAFAVGKDIGGQVVVTDIAKMPHLLIAGATGSGKSVCINTLIMSIIFKSKPEDVKLIMVDPKVVELSVYNGIPHLLIPVVTDPKKASGALNWAVAEMTDRYKKFAECNVRDLKGYNERVEKIKDIEDEKKPQKLPQIVIIVDELADLMMVAPGEVEDAICRLAQLARAAGIHLVIATQRPSVNVITGLIKANVPSRIAFSVSSGVDSRTIIDMNGAEKLLGKGDMLFYPAGFPKPQRVQGAFVSDEEVGRVVDFLTEQGMVAEYSPEVESRVSSPSMDAGSSQSDRDEYFIQAARFIIEKDKASIGMLQRMFKIGFNRAARIMDQLAEAGVVGEEEGTKPRKILMSAQEFEEFMEQ